ncbi:MAG: hypothetical protein ABR528_04085 [Pseudonocardiaceae bacterium]|jgi:hypothetical protein
MSNVDKDIDEAAEPFMEQAEESLGDVADDEDPENTENPSPRLGHRAGRHRQADTQPPS